MPLFFGMYFLKFVIPQRRPEQVCEGSLNTLVNLRGSQSYVAEKGSPGEQRLTNGKDGASIEVGTRTRNEQRCGREMGGDGMDEDLGE